MPVEGTFRAHQVPLGGVRENPEHLAMLEEWMRSYRPEELLRRRRAASSPSWRRSRRGRAADGREPARQRRPPPGRRCDIPDSADYAIDGRRARRPSWPNRPGALGELLRDVYARQRRRGQLPPLLPRRDQLQPARRRLRGREPLPDRTPGPSDDHVSPDGPGDGGALRAQLPGLARGLPADRPPRALRHLRGVRDGLGLDDDPAHQVAGGDAAAGVAARRSPRSTSCSPRPAGATTTTASATRARA